MACSAGIGLRTRTTASHARNLPQDRCRDSTIVKSYESSVFCFVFLFLIALFEGGVLHYTLTAEKSGTFSSKAHLDAPLQARDVRILRKDKAVVSGEVGDGVQL